MILIGRCLRKQCRIEWNHLVGLNRSPQSMQASLKRLDKPHDGSIFSDPLARFPELDVIPDLSMNPLESALVTEATSTINTFPVFTRVHF